MIRVFGLWPLAVGIVPHRDVSSRLTFVVKATYAIPETPGETATLLPRQPPLRADEPHPLAAYISGDDYAYASDLVPRKKEVDVTVTGSASAASAESSIFSRISVGGVSHDIVVQSSAPALEIPLVSDYLRTLDGHAAPRLAPGRPLGPRLRRARVASAAEAAFAPHFLDVATSEDGTGFQSASPEMRLPIPFDHRAEIFLEGLGHRTTASGTQRWFWLPGYVPVAAVRGAGVTKEIPLVCDTVHFELDRDTVTVVHRAAIPIPLRGKPDLDVVVGLAGKGEAIDAATLLSRMGEARPLRVATLAPDGSVAWLPLPEAPSAPRQPIRAPALDFDEGYGSTEAVDASKLAAALPFAGIKAPARSPGSERPPDRAPPPPPSARSLEHFDQRSATGKPADSSSDVEATNAFSVSALLAKIGLSPDALAQVGEGQVDGESGGTLALSPEASAAALSRAPAPPPVGTTGGATLALTPEASAAALALHARGAPDGDFDATGKLSAADLMKRVQAPAPPPPAPPPPAGTRAAETTQALHVSADLRALYDDSDDSGPGTLAIAKAAPEAASLSHDDDAGPGTLAIAAAPRSAAFADLDDAGPGTLAIAAAPGRASADVDDAGPGTLALAQAPAPASFDDTGELDAAKLAARASLPFGPGDPQRTEDPVARWIERVRDAGEPEERSAGNTRAVDVQALLGAPQLPFGGAAKVPAPMPAAPPAVVPPAPVPPAPIPPAPAPIGPSAISGEDVRTFDETDHGGSTRGIDIRELMARGKIPFLHAAEPAPQSARALSLEGLPFQGDEAEAPDSAGVQPVRIDAPKSGRRGEMVPTVTDGPISVATFSWQLLPPQEVLVVVAKASFTLAAGEQAPFEEKPELPLGDVFADDEASGSLIHASDLAIMKSEVDVLVKGHAWAPNGRASAMQVAVRLRGAQTKLDRELAVFGDRTWQRAMVAAVPSPPAPFEVIPIAWERSYGGTGSPDNPVGVGYRGAKDKEGRPMLPNFEQPGRLIKSPDDTPAPAGLGPIHPLWPKRWSAMGTYDVAWAKSRFPYFAADFDPKFFQAAPAPQRLAKLEGDERYELVGLHKEYGVLGGRLPGVRLRAFAQRTADAGGAFIEIPLRVDTLTFDPDQDQMHLVWRGRVDVSDDDAPEIEEIFVTSELLTEPPITLVEARRRHATARQQEEEPEPEDEPREEPESDGPDPEREAAIRKVEALIAQARADVGAAPEPPPDLTPPPPPPPADPEVLAGTLRAAGATEAEIAKLVAAITTKPATEPPPAGDPDLRARVIARMAAGEALSELDLAGADLRDLDLSGQSLAGSDLTSARLDRADLSGADLTLARLERASLVAARLGGATLDGAELYGTDLTQAVLAHASLVKLDSREARWVDADLCGAMVDEAQMVASDLTGAKLDGAKGKDLDLTGSLLDKATFTQAALPQVRLYDTRGRGAVFDHADLTNARADNAVLTQSSFREIEGAQSIWERAELTNSTFQGANLEEASFVRSTCLKTIFNEADLTNARLRKAKMNGAMFVRANLKDASCDRVDFELADLRGANLHAANLHRATMRHAKLDEAIITQSSLDKRQP